MRNTALTYEPGNIEKSSRLLNSFLSDCQLCPRQCRVNRLKGKKGYCRSGAELIISSYGPHHGEEPFLSGTKGSGAIFFTNCNLKCVYCQNYQISQEGVGKKYSIEDLAGMMLELQEQGCHNINLVSPTHYLPQIVEALGLAFDQGLDLPIVYNTNGYDRPEIIRLLEGIVDIYLPDAKYADNQIAAKYSDAAGYVEFNRAALKEMYRQVGDLELSDDGLAIKGLVIRHPVLPGGLAGTEATLKFIAGELSKEVTIGLMAQYHPCWRAGKYPELNRGLKPDEYQRALDWLAEAGINNYLKQTLDSSEDLLSDFGKDKPFNK